MKEKKPNHTYTERYDAMEEYINETVTLRVNFQKYGILHGTNDKATLLTNIKLNNHYKLDHIWVDSQVLVAAKLRTNQPITIEATVKIRKRPPEDIFAPPLIDINLRNITILKKERKNEKNNYTRNSIP